MKGIVSPQYPIQRAHRAPYVNLNRLEYARETEVLTGQVNGLKASDLEERWARAAVFEKKSFDFQVSFLAERGLPGEYRLDFMMYGLGLPRPVQIDGEIAHKTAGKQSADFIQDAQFNDNYAAQYKRVLRVMWYQIPDVDSARRIIRLVV